MNPFYDVGPILRGLARQKSAFLLLVSEAALAFAVISTIIWVGSWYHGRGSVNPGYDVAGLISVASMGGAEPLHAADARRQREMRALANVGGVVSVAAISGDVMDARWLTAWPVRSAEGDMPAAAGCWVLDGEGALPKTLGLRSIEGTLAQNAATEILVSRSMAQAFFPGSSAVGRRLHLPDEALPFSIVGVYEDVELVIPYLANPTLTVIRQRPAGDERGSRYLVRVDADRRSQLISALSAALLRVDGARSYDVRAFDLKTARHVMTSDGLIDTLGIIALVLAAVALLGSLAITAFLVQQRIRQVGIRRALGATPGDIVHQFLIENGVAVALGCVFGLGISLAYYFSLGHLFPGVTLSALQFGFTALLLFVDGALATLVPALRAARIPPTVASRAL